MNIHIINGPNLNLLGSREVEIYGDKSFDEYLKELKTNFPEVTITYFQSNIEGEIIDSIHKCRKETDGLIINAGGYSHTSVAIADALGVLSIPIVEVHISNIYKRESYRHESLTATKCIGVISGFGLPGYEMAINFLKKNFTKASS